MTTANPYQAPNANISNNNSETYQPQIFTSKGRIGRMRYLAYSLSAYLILIPFIIVGSIISALMADSHAAEQVTTAFILIAYIPMLVLFCMISKRASMI